MWLNHLSFSKAVPFLATPQIARQACPAVGAVAEAKAVAVRAAEVSLPNLVAIVAAERCFVPVVPVAQRCLESLFPLLPSAASTVRARWFRPYSLRALLSSVSFDRIRANTTRVSGQAIGEGVGAAGVDRWDDAAGLGQPWVAHSCCTPLHLR